MKRRTLIKYLSFAATSTIARSALAKKIPPQNTDRLSTKKTRSREINIKEIGAHSSTENGFNNFDNRKIIQTAIDYCNMQYNNELIRWSIIIPDGVFLVTATTHAEASGNLNGISSLLIRSNIIIKGTGTIKLSDAQYGPGAFFRLLSSNREGNHLENVDIINISIDGNAEKQYPGVQASNILLECKENIKIEAIHSYNCNGNGIQIRGSNDKNNAVKNVVINKCKVNACKKIGIQIAQFDGLKIQKNKISDCVDNGIDIYGDMGIKTAPNINGNNFDISENIVSNCLNGIFPETVANGTIYKNIINEIIESGIHINRIHGLPSNISIFKNKIHGGKFGFTFTGDMKNIYIANNTVSSLKESFIVLGGGGGNSSNITVKDNNFIFSSNKERLVILNGNIIRKIEISGNRLNHEKNTKKNACEEKLIENNANSIDYTVNINNCTLLK